ncbi:MAG TPA: hypothetical protein VGO58_18935 [Chitinophagaceae bacterium]|jgi:hypothetical protein|nr:hypothetical protein [Chitinophagaceae bacterium]
MWFKIYKFSVLASSFLFASCGSNTMLKEVKKLDHYPSASGIEYFNKQYYVIGDDANDLLVLDSNLNPVDSLDLYSFPDKRIPKAVKADLEAIITTEGKKILLIGSGSLAPYRNTCWLIDPVTKQKDSIRLDIFYERLKQSGLSELNIEGGCSIPGSIFLSNRGSKGFPRNHLILTSASFWKEQNSARITVISVGGNTDTSLFKGVSGMTYAKKSDRLILAVSTEDTRNNMDDGAIGKSYLWIIENISSKKGWKAINPDQVIDLGDIDPKFNGQKIESVCVTKETRNFLHLVLAADNDDGSSSIFRLIVEKN